MVQIYQIFGCKSTSLFEFIKWILPAFVPAISVICYAMSRWLANIRGPNHYFSNTKLQYWKIPLAKLL
jgi:hypothetical protein